MVHIHNASSEFDYTSGMMQSALEHVKVEQSQ